MGRHPHVAVCICTYKRQRILARLLRAVQDQDTAQLFTCSIVVVDNDSAESARAPVESMAADSPIPIAYYCEPERNIALARNKALENAAGEFVAMIDDDEIPGPGWLVTMFKALKAYKADGVLGPVKPQFEETPPQWVVDGKFYEKPGRKGHRDGDVLHWLDTRTSNVFMRRDIIANGDMLFRAALGRGGEDKEFFSRMIATGRVFVWCNEAPVFEVIPPGRCRRTFMLKRALLRGKVSLLYPCAGLRDNLKSVLAIILYTPALPFLLLRGQHIFMAYLIAYCDHIGKILGLVGLDVIKEKYLME